MLSAVTFDHISCLIQAQVRNGFHPVLLSAFNKLIVRRQLSTLAPHRLIA